MDKDLYTVSDLAVMFGKSTQTIHNWILVKGKFPNHFTVGEGGGKMILVPASDVKVVAEEEVEKLQKGLRRLSSFVALGKESQGSSTLLVATV